MLISSASILAACCRVRGDGSRLLCWRGLGMKFGHALLGGCGGDNNHHRDGGGLHKAPLERLEQLGDDFAMRVGARVSLALAFQPLAQTNQMDESLLSNACCATSMLSQWLSCLVDAAVATVDCPPLGL